MNNIFLFIAVICVIIIVLLPCIKTYIKIPLALATLSYIALASHDKPKIIGGQYNNNGIWHGRHIDNFDISNYWADSKMVLTKMFKRLGKRYNHNKTEIENIYMNYINYKIKMRNGVLTAINLIATLLKENLGKI